VKKINLFWKTWIVIFFSLLLTGLIFVLSYSHLVQKSHEREQVRKLKEYKQQIYDELIQNGMNENLMAQYLHKGCFVNITEGGKSIYPPPTQGFIFRTDTFLDENIIIAEDTNEYLLNKFDVGYQNHTYSVTLMIPKVAYSYRTFTEFIPTFLGIGLFATGLISFLYSFYFSRRIDRLNKKILRMSNMEDQIERDLPNGDELVTLEQYLNEMYRQLRKALNDRVFFTRGATHELKTPIMAVTAMLEGMIWNITGFEDREYYLQECLLQMERMTKLVNEILNLSQLEQLQEGKTKIYDVILELQNHYEIIAKDKECQIMITCDNEELEINLLKQNLSKVLSNLLSNAIKYTPDQSVIDITITGEMFSISNKCEGLELDATKDLFHPFTLGTNSKEGHGLGLYIVKTILNTAKIEPVYLLENGTFTVKFGMSRSNSV
jgi:histidine kinase